MGRRHTKSSHDDLRTVVADGNYGRNYMCYHDARLWTIDAITGICEQSNNALACVLAPLCPV